MKLTAHAVRAFATAFALGSLAAQGAIIFDNFGPGDSTAAFGRAVQGPDVTLLDHPLREAVKINVGSSPVVLQKITVAVGVVQNVGVFQEGFGQLLLQAWTDNGGVPGNNIRSVGFYVGTTTPTVWFDFPPNYIAANSDIWVIASGFDTYNGSWAFNNTGDQGITAGKTGSVSDPWTVRPIGLRYALRVEGDIENPTPEPGSMAMFGSGAIALIAMARRVRLSR